MTVCGKRELWPIPLLLCFDNGREAVKRYEELSSIFSEQDNYSQSRELLKEVSHGLIRLGCHGSIRLRL